MVFTISQKINNMSQEINPNTEKDQNPSEINNNDSIAKSHWQKFKIWYLFLVILICSNSYCLIQWKLDADDKRKTYDSKQKEAYLLLTKSLGWSIQNAVIHNKMDEIDVKLIDIIKNQDLIMEAMYVDVNSLKINVSTNKKNEGQPINKLLDKDLVNIGQLSLSVKNNQLYSVCPLPSTNQKKGVLVLTLDNNF
jgi:hypothetical protein